MGRRRFATATICHGRGRPTGCGRIALLPVLLPARLPLGNLFPHPRDHLSFGTAAAADSLWPNYSTHLCEPTTKLLLLLLRRRRRIRSYANLFFLQQRRRQHHQRWPRLSWRKKDTLPHAIVAGRRRYIFSSLVDEQLCTITHRKHTNSRFLFPPKKRRTTRRKRRRTTIHTNQGKKDEKLIHS